MPATYEKIATTTLGSASATITFSSIAASWTDLRVVIIASTSTGTDGLNLRFNSDTGTNYSHTILYGTGTAAASFRSTNDNRIPFNDNGSGMTTAKGFYTADIFSYAGSTFKTCLHSTSYDRNGSGEVERGVALWRSTSAINNISIFTTSSTTMPIGTIATLYGILKA